MDTNQSRSNIKPQLYSRGNVPFSWENKPGVTKVSHTNTEYYFIKGDDYKLPPPPRVTFHGDHQLPLPPPISRNSSSKGFIGNKVEGEDPFQVAILECTKSVKATCGDATAQSKVKIPSTSFPARKYNGGFGSGLKSLFESLSCKRSNTAVRDDTMVKVCREPYCPYTSSRNAALDN